MADEILNQTEALEEAAEPIEAAEIPAEPAENLPEAEASAPDAAPVPQEPEADAESQAAEEAGESEASGEASPEVREADTADQPDSVPEGGELSDDEEPVKEYKGSPASSVLAGILGCIIGVIISALGGGLGSTIGWFLVVAIPLCICGLNLLLKGHRGAVGIALESVFTAAGIYILPALTAAAEVTARKGVSVLSAPLLALSKIGEANYLTDFALNSAHIFPIIYAIIGVLLSYEFFKLKKKES